MNRASLEIFAAQIRKVFLDLFHLCWALIVFCLCGTAISQYILWIAEGGKNEAMVKYILYGDWLEAVPW